MQAVSGLLIVVGLIIFVGYFAKKMQQKGGWGGILGPSKGRFKIAETIRLDATRQLILVDRDRSTSYVILLGNGTEMLIESLPYIPSLAAASSASPQAQAQAQTARSTARSPDAATPPLSSFSTSFESSFKPMKNHDMTTRPENFRD